MDSSDISEMFAKFNEEDYAVVGFADSRTVGNPDEQTPIDLAKRIIEASQEGKKPVNFRLKSSDEYWENWAWHGNCELLDAALDHLGYDRTFQTNSTSDGRDYLLKRKE